MVRALGGGDVAAAIGARISGSSDHVLTHNTTHRSRRAAHCDAALTVVTLCHCGVVALCCCQVMNLVR